MKDFFNKIAEVFQNMDGSTSARRVGGVALIVCGLVGWFMKLDVTVCSVVIGLGAALLGITSVDNHPLA
ncbi:MAG: hypothetical protein WC455_13980 [Dehalococcoidia bacterium]|jgi:hypothetical protein